MINYSYLRPTKANQLKMLHNNELFKNDSLDARLYDNATVLPLKKFANDTLVWGRGGLVDSNGDYVCDSGIDGFVNDAYDYSNSDYIDEKVAYCGYLRFEWGHLIVDCSTRLYYVLQHYNEIDHFVFFIDENAKRELYGNFKEFFELSGIIDKLLIINKPTKFNRIIVPTKSYDRHKKYCYKDLYSLIFDTIRNSESVFHNTSLQYEKIYFSRSKLTNAQKLEFGHDLLDDFFIKNGYRILYPESIRLRDLISVIDNAKEIACVSGTIPHNMIFSNGNAHITIIERHCLNNDIQADINRIKDLNVTYVDANMCIYPTEISYGPFIFAYNTWFSNYANDCGLLPPNDYYFQKKFIRHLYRKYKEKYTADHYESLYLPGYMVSFAENIWEAYSESEDFFKNYIFGIEPYKLSQCFTPRMMKRIVRIIIYKLLKKE